MAKLRPFQPSGDEVHEIAAHLAVQQQWSVVNESGERNDHRERHLAESPQWDAVGMQLQGHQEAHRQWGVFLET